MDATLEHQNTEVPAMAEIPVALLEQISFKILSYIILYQEMNSRTILLHPTFAIGL